MLLLKFGLFTPASNVFLFRFSTDWWWWAYPGDDEWSGEVWAADEPQPPVDVAALAAECHRERMQPPHGEGRGVRCTGASTRARCADGASSTGRRGVVRAKLASTPTLHPAPPPVGLHRLHVPLVHYHTTLRRIRPTLIYGNWRKWRKQTFSCCNVWTSCFVYWIKFWIVLEDVLYITARTDLFCWDNKLIDRQLHLCMQYCMFNLQLY